MQKIRLKDQPENSPRLNLRNEDMKTLKKPKKAIKNKPKLVKLPQ